MHLRHACSVSPTLLIVDDHAEFRAVARELLSHAYFEVTGEAADGESALQAIADLHPDVVLLDVQLPDFDGFEVLRRLAELPDQPAVVLTSTRRRSEYRDRLSHCSARGFIAKEDICADGLAAVLA